MRGFPFLCFNSHLKDIKYWLPLLTKENNAGVPQRLILGPNIFLAYIHDLPRISNDFSFALYANATMLLTRNHNFNSLLCTLWSTNYVSQSTYVRHTVFHIVRLSLNNSHVIYTNRLGFESRLIIYVRMSVCPSVAF